MILIKLDLPKDLESVEIHPFADEHIGNPQSELKRVQDRIEYVRTHEQAYCILNGDLMDNVTKTSVGDLFMQEFNPMKQLQMAVALFEPIKDKILCITHGNHENRSYKNEGVDMTRMIAAQLGILDRYSPAAAVLFLSVGNGTPHNHNFPIKYSFYVLHGTGGGRKEGAKAIRLADMASIIDCDIYIHSHTHMPMVFKTGFYRVTNKYEDIEYVEKLFVNTASNLSYGGYGEAGEYKPTSMQTPVITLSGITKKYSARL